MHEDSTKYSVTILLRTKVFYPAAVGYLYMLYITQDYTDLS
jgi:hypothetical protein